MKPVHLLSTIFTAMAIAAPSAELGNTGLEARACLPASCTSFGVSLFVYAFTFRGDLKLKNFFVL